VLPIAQVRAAAEQLDSDERGELVRVAGRVRAVRCHGQLTFADLTGEGAIQLLIDAAAQADAISVGDVVWAEGAICRSRRGEPSIAVQRLVLLAPCLRPLPDAQAGIRDTGVRRRERAMHLMSDDSARQVIIMRSRIVQALRSTLLADGYLEVETPILQPRSSGDAEQFSTHCRALGRELHMRTAPEFDLERLVTAGIERVFEFARNFRNEGADRTHSPEFTALEAYGAWEALTDQLARCRRLLSAACDAAQQGDHPLRSVQEVSFGELWRQRWGGDALDELSVRAALGPGEHAQLLERGWAEIERDLRGALAVTDWPAIISPLARPVDADPRLAARFDLYLDGMELGAAYQEYNDPAGQRRAMQRCGQLDEAMLRDMELGMPPMAGLGLGVDRLVMVLTQSEHIRDVIAL
jgi:lysyl-tRNA synthetase class 2